MRLEVIRGDITKLEVDAIVNGLAREAMSVARNRRTRAPGAQHLRPTASNRSSRGWSARRPEGASRDTPGQGVRKDGSPKGCSKSTKRIVGLEDRE